MPSCAAKADEFFGGHLLHFVMVENVHGLDLPIFLVDVHMSVQVHENVFIVLEAPVDVYLQELILLERWVEVDGLFLEISFIGELDS